MQPRSHGRGGDAEDLGELGSAQLFPVVQLERDLEVDREVQHRLGDHRLLFRGDGGAARGDPEVADRAYGLFQAVAYSVARAAFDEMIKLAACDREEVGAELSLGAEFRNGLEARDQGALDEVLDLADRCLCPKKPAQALKVPLEQPAA